MLFIQSWKKVSYVELPTLKNPGLERAHLGF